jgi:hypothetical protein
MTYTQGQVLRLRVREEQIPNRRETSAGYTRHTTTNHTQGNAELLGYCGHMLGFRAIALYNMTTATYD